MEFQNGGAPTVLANVILLSEANTGKKIPIL
jgi:hypothetical protein